MVCQRSGIGTLRPPGQPSSLRTGRASDAHSGLCSDLVSGVICGVDRHLSTECPLGFSPPFLWADCCSPARSLLQVSLRFKRHVGPFPPWVAEVLLHLAFGFTSCLSTCLAFHFGLSNPPNWFFKSVCIWWHLSNISLILSSYKSSDIFYTLIGLH